MEFSRIWEEFEIQDGKTCRWSIGSLTIWLERHADEWLIAQEYRDDETALYGPGTRTRNEKKPEDPGWTRFVAAVRKSSVIMQPIMNEKPIVVSAEHPLMILPKNEALVFVNVPVNIRLYAGKREALLADIPSIALSKTWFGEMSDGEMCLSLKTSAVRSKDLLSPKPNRAGCPVLIKNLSATPLEVQKLCLHTENLAIYRSSDRLWTNRVVISYLGPDKTSEVRRIKGAPGMSPGEILLSEARVPVREWLFRKSFDLLRKLYLN